MNFQSTRTMRDVANIVSISFWEVPNLGLLLRWIGVLNLQTKLVSMEEHFGRVQDSNSPCQFLADVFCIYLDLFKKSRLLIFCRTPFLAFWPLFLVLHYHTTTYGNMNWMWGIKFECLYGDEWMNDKLMWAQLNSRQGIKSHESQELGNVIYICKWIAAATCLAFWRAVHTCSCNLNEFVLVFFLVQ
jgi:hypothetical protein